MDVEDVPIREVTKKLLIPRKSFIRTVLALTKMPNKFIDPLEVEKISGVSRASVYKELKILTSPPFEWLERKGERKFVWRSRNIKEALKALFDQIEKTINEIDNIQKELTKKEN